MRWARATMKLGMVGLIVTLAFGLLAAPLLAGGQEKEKVWRLGLVHVGLDHILGTLEPFRKELTALGYQEGKNVRLDFGVPGVAGGKFAVLYIEVDCICHTTSIGE